jgi:hypothetical protein
MDTRQNRRTSIAYSVPCRFANMNRSAICNLRHNELLYDRNGGQRLIPVIAPTQSKCLRRVGGQRFYNRAGSRPS